MLRKGCKFPYFSILLFFFLLLWSSSLESLFIELKFFSPPSPPLNTTVLPIQMAVELCLSDPNGNNCPWSSSATNTGTVVGSPRLSFSRDLKQQEEGGNDEREKANERLDGSFLLSLGSPTNSDFDFCIPREEGSVQEHSTADELFADGKILPLPIQTQIKIRNAQFGTNPNWAPPKSTSIATSSSSRLPPTPSPKPEGKERLKDIIADDGEIKKPTKTSTSFWKFGRSTSLNYGGNVTNFICSSMTLLTRSKSTGSNLNPKSSSSTNQTQKQQQQRKNGNINNRSKGKAVTRTSSSSFTSSSSSSSSSSSYYYGSSCHGQYGNSGVRISPVLNVPHPHIPKGSNDRNGFLGFGLFTCSSSKEKSSNKKKTQFPAQQHP